MRSSSFPLPPPHPLPPSATSWRVTAVVDSADIKYRVLSRLETASSSRLRFVVRDDSVGESNRAIDSTFTRMHRTRKSATKEDPLSLIAQRRKDEMIETLKAPATAKRFRSFLAGARFRSHIFTLRKWANSGGGGRGSCAGNKIAGDSPLRPPSPTRYRAGRGTTDRSDRIGGEGEGQAGVNKGASSYGRQPVVGGRSHSRLMARNLRTTSLPGVRSLLSLPLSASTAHASMRDYYSPSESREGRLRGDGAGARARDIRKMKRHENLDDRCQRRGDRRGIKTAEL